MKKLNFIFTVHNHQPVGNFHEVLDRAYTQSYYPFIDIMEKHPGVKFALHCSGILWEWFKEYRPEYMETIKKLLARNQIELIAGAHYEPILPVLPDCDKTGQINKIKQFIKHEFGTESTGFWVAERVWEPHLTKNLAETGIKYTFLDDTHFYAAGVSQDKLSGYYVTEEQGRILKVFPISQELRYLIPFSPKPEQVIDYFRSQADESGNKVLVLADDGEKFGIWPETYKHVYQEQWLDRFLSLLEENKDWLNTVFPGEYINNNVPQGRIYFPTASYFEMSEWSLPAQVSQDFEDILMGIASTPYDKQLRRFLKGGIWRNFLVKYEESNNMHKKMLLVSEKVNQAVQQSLIPKNRAHDALDALWRGQCNCAYWHGVFGGLYLPHLRQAIYQNLIDAETIIDHAEETKTNKIDFCEKDFNSDGKNELLVDTKIFHLYFDPNYGGTLFEFDFIPNLTNLNNVLSRRYESYHRRLCEYLNNRSKYQSEEAIKTIHHLVRVKEEGLENYLCYDWYHKRSLIDHFFHPDTTWENFRQCHYGEQGNFVNQPYQVSVKKDKHKLKLNFARTGDVWVNQEQFKLKTEKNVTVDDGSDLEVEYRFKGQNNKNMAVRFGSEFNFAFFDRDYDFTELKQQKIWTHTDNNLKIKVTLEFDQPADIWIFPLETVSLSEGGFERICQGWTVCPHWDLVIEPGIEKKIKFCLKVEKI